MSATIVSSRPRGASSSPAGLWGLFIFSALLLSPAVLAPILSPAPISESLSSLALSVVFWSFWVALWGKPRLACLAAMPFLIVVPSTVYLLLTYHAPLNAAVLGILLETNVEESTQYLRGIWLPAILSYAALIATAYFALRLMGRHQIVWQRRYRLVALAAAPTILAALHFLYQPLETAGAGLQSKLDPYRTTQWPLEVESTRFTTPFGVLLQISDAIEAERKIAAASRTREAFRFGAYQTPASPDPQVYVLVIGESARKDRWSLNGYARQTSPRLEQETDLVNFSDVITVVPSTRISVPVILTRRNSEQAWSWEFPERSLVSAFREAGFATYWLSTQAPMGTFDASFSTYAREAEHVAYYNVTAGMSETPPDGVMIEPLKRILANAGEKRQLVVIHTLGSHLEYRRRYPDEFDIFKPSLTRTDPAIWHDEAYKKELSNAYDNTIRYTDYFLSEVLAAVKASGRPLATVLYVPDHGEDLYDGGCDNWGHGKATVAGFRIPLFFWYSKAYQRAFPGKVTALEQHRDEPLTTETVFPLLLDAAGIRFPGEDLTRSVMSASFVRQSKRVVSGIDGNRVDFDHAHPNNQCLLVN